MVQTLLIILVCLVLAYIFPQFLKLFGMPRVVGQVGAGLVLSIATVNYGIFNAEDFKVISFLSELGIILLFYYIGLETDFKIFKKNIKKSVLVSLFNTCLPFIAGFLAMKYIFHFSTFPSVIIAVSLSVSAQSVSADMLEELKKIKSKIGSLIIFIGAVDDVIELFLITVVLSLFHFAARDLTSSNLIADVLIFAVMIIIAKVWFIPYTLRAFGKEQSSTSRFMGSMIIVLLIAYLSEFIGIGSIIGAMVAGIIVRQAILKDGAIPNWQEYDIARSTHIIAFGFLIPLFFVSVGLNANLNSISVDIPLIFILVLIAIVGTVGGTALATVLSKGTLKEGLVLGWGLNPKGDVELVLATIGLKLGIINQEIFTALVLMSLITTIISAVVFKRIIVNYKS